jgi:hypothetical protein
MRDMRDVPACVQFMELLEGNRVLEHTLMRNKVLDGDNHVLHVQVRPSGLALVCTCMCVVWSRTA